MKSRLLITVVMLLGSAAGPLWAQSSVPSGPHMEAAGPAAPSLPLRFSLFDPSRFSMSHSYSLMFSTDGNSTASQGLYLNTMRYQVSAPLLLTLRWGMYHNPSLLKKESAAPSTGGLVVPDVELQYRPSKNFMLKVRYSQMLSGPQPAAGPFYHLLTD